MFSPDRGEIYSIQTGLRGWRDVYGMGPDYLISVKMESELHAYICGKPCDVAALTAELSAARARVVNFFDLLYSDGEFHPRPANSFDAETTCFLLQFKEQAAIWTSGIFHSLDFSPREIEILARVSVKVSPALFLMGFADAIPHSSQVSRLCASMAHTLQGRHSEILQAAIVGKLHDPKFEPKLDVARQNLATHPVVAVALANTIFQDESLRALLKTNFNGNETLVCEFVDGILDALGINNDSWFVQMMFILPNLVKKIEAKYGPEVAGGFKSVMEGRLESASKGTPPPSLPAYLHGVLQQETIDSGLRGVSKHGWQKALQDAGINGITGDAASNLFNELLNGNLGLVTQTQVAFLRQSLRSNNNAILTAQISMTRLLHHHQEVIPSGQLAALALFISDPMMLSPHKVGAVYQTAMIERLKSYIKSFDDNIRLLPACAREIGVLWQRAVYLSMLLAADRLTGSSKVKFAASRTNSDAQKDVDDMRPLLLNEATWGKWAAAAGSAASVPEVKQALDALEAAYVQVVAQYRVAVQKKEPLDKFMPVG
jgi:hypothetical protein